MKRMNSVNIRLSSDEHEWLRRYAHWQETSVAEIMRKLLHEQIGQIGYLRPADDEPQDFGYEKEMMQFVNEFEE